MKKVLKSYLMVLLALLLCVGCSEEKSGEHEVDFSTLTHEELLTTKGGLDYLVSLGESFNQEVLIERLEKEVLDACENEQWYRVDGNWQKEYTLGGVGSTKFLSMGQSTVRACFMLSVLMDGKVDDVKVYQDIPVRENPITNITTEIGGGWKIVAYVGDYVVFERAKEYGAARIVSKFYDNRDKVLVDYAIDYETIDHSAIFPE